MTLTPAYGRDYKSAKDVRADWNADKDFVIADIVNPDCGRYVNRPQVTGQTIYIRYKRLTQIVKVQ